MASSDRRPMDPVDAAWYRMDRPNNPAVVTGLLALGDHVQPDEIQDVFSDRLLPFERFQYRIVERGWPWALPHWERDPDFELDNHVHSRTVTPPVTKEALLETVAEIASQPLDRDRPPWDAHILSTGPDSSALVMRFHHCMADGTASIALADKLLDPLEAGRSEMAEPRRVSTLPSCSSLAERTVRYTQRGLGTALDRMLRPLDTVRDLPSVVSALGVTAESVLQENDPPSPLRRTLTGTQRLGYTTPLPLAEIKKLGAHANATVNDVMVAALAGALRSALLTPGRTAALPTLRAIVPVDLRSHDEALELGNAFGLTFLDLPLNEATPAERLRAAKSGMDAIKHSPEARVFLNILGLFGQLPHTVEDVASSLFAAKSSLVMTNVTGPTQTRTLAGAPVNNIVFWVPHPVTLGVGVSILSYAGTVSVGVITDAAIDLDPETVTSGIARELTALKSVAASAGPADSTPASIEQTSTV